MEYTVSFLRIFVNLIPDTGPDPKPVSDKARLQLEQ
jgi:hypothetical protein